MNRALVAGAEGMAAQQAALDAISANLANIDTPGFRAARPEFAALMASSGASLGTDAVTRKTLFSPGRIEATDDPHDIAIEGEGLFRVRTPQGRIAFTRAGNFTPDAHGKLVLPDGSSLEGVCMPGGTTRIEIAADGRVRACVAGKPGSRSAGHISLYSFDDCSALSLGADGLFYQTTSSGRPFRGRPGIGGFGRIRQQCLERANVSVVEQMMAILAAQRAYEANAKTVQAADEMLRLANNLERG